MLKPIEIRVRPGCCLCKRIQIQHVDLAGLIQVWVSRCVVTGRGRCKKCFFSFYGICVAQETGRNSACDHFWLGGFYFLYMLYWVFLHPHCVWKCSKVIFFNMTIIHSMGLLYSAQNLMFGSELCLNFWLWLFMASCNTRVTCWLMLQIGQLEK